MPDDQIRVMHIISNLDIGGAQEVVRTLTAYLAEAGCSPVVCSFRDGPLRHEIERLGIPVEIVPGRRASILALPLFIADMWRIRRALIDLVNKHRIQVIQTHLLQVLDFLVLTLRSNHRLSVFWTIHNYNFALRADQLPRHRWLLRPKRSAYRLLYRAAARRVDGFVAVSDQVATAILNTIGPIGDKITIICNGVDVQRYTHAGDHDGVRRALDLAENARLITTVGTLKEQKGHRFLIDAARSIIARHPDVHLLFVGDGERRADLEAQTVAHGLDRHIHFAGNRSDVPNLLAASDMFVLPSLWEGLPMALIEAMASELPIVATDVSGTKQVIVAGKTGLIVPPGDAAQLKTAILDLLADPARARMMASAARRRVATLFSARKQAEEHIALYRRARMQPVTPHAQVQAEQHI